MSSQREVRKTVFAFGEGETENYFLKHLRSLYAAGKTQTTVDHAGGKDVRYIITKAVKIRSHSAYDHSFILLDTVPTWPTTAIQLANKNGFELIGSDPCVEAVFRRILETRRDISGNSSTTHKKMFSNQYINGKSLISEADCRRLFLKSRTDAARTSLQILDRIISIMEGTF